MLKRVAIAVLLLAATRAHAQTQPGWLSASQNPGGTLVLAPQVDSFLGTKMDDTGGVCTNCSFSGGTFVNGSFQAGTFTSAVMSGMISTGATISGGTVASPVDNSTVGGTALVTLFGGLTRNVPNGVAGLDANGLMAVANLPDLGSALVNGQTLTVALSGVGGGNVTDITNLHVTVNGSSVVAGPAISSISTVASAALPRASAGPLATVQGANASAAITAALGFAPYSAANPAGYLTAATLASSAPVQSVVSQTGSITAGQIAAALQGQNLTGAIIGNGKTGTQIAAAETTDAGNITTLNGQVAALQGAGSGGLQVGDIGHSIAGLASGNLVNDLNQPSGAQNITVIPTGNSPATLSSINLQANAVSSSQREFAVNLGLTSNTGIVNNGNADKVTLYAGMKCLAGSGQCWAANFLFNADSGMTASATGLEADGNNSGADAPLYSSRGLVGVGANGTISGSSNYMSAGMEVASVNSVNIWHAGYAVVGNAAHDEAFYDTGNSQYSYLNTGNHSTAVLDDTSTTPAFAITTGHYSTATYDDAGTSPAAFDLSGTYSIAAIYIQSANTSNAIVVGPGKKYCVNGSGSACFYYKSSTNQWIFTDVNNNPAMALGTGGNLSIKGTLTQNTTITP